MNGFRVVVLACGLLTLESYGATIHVPAEFPTIQAAIVAAGQLDVIVVAPGSYHETINFLGKGITVRSSGGRDVTTIDAMGLGASVVTCINGEGPDTVLDGFTITGGTGSDPFGSGYAGGGMYNDYSSPTVRNCTFSGNMGYSGGGGMVNYSSSPTVSDCTFSGNTTHSGGGGMHNDSSSPIVTDCTFSGNIADTGGGMYNNYSSPNVSHNTFSGNTSTSWGGGIWNDDSNPTVSNCTFSANTARDGGGMYNYRGSNPTVTNCTFSGNTATNTGGGMVNDFSSPTVTHCTFTRNTAAYGGGGLVNVVSNSRVTNCVLWGDSPNEIVNYLFASPTIRFSDLQGGFPVGAVNGGGNIYLNPMFMCPPGSGPDCTSDGDLRLRGGSPCINVGDPGFVAQPGETDLEGHARVLCGRVDMGAYEFGIGDYNCDQEVNLSDFVGWGTCMLGPDNGPYGAACRAFDGNLDLDVDLHDFAIFQNSMIAP